MKIALAQLNYHIGNFELNTQKIIASIEKAKKQGADLVVFAELALCGYPPRDFLEWQEFIDRCELALQEIANACTDIAAIVGAPARNPVVEGKDLYNAAFFMEDGKIKSRSDKTLLPTYDVFDEYRYFEPNRRFEVIPFKGKKIALTICEDLWNINDNPLYVSCPMDELIKQSPDLMINIAASPFDYTHREDRLIALQANCEKYQIPLFYVNHVGSQTELVFDGGSLVLDKNGNIVDEMAYFEEDLKVYELTEIQASTLKSPKPDNNFTHTEIDQLSYEFRHSDIAIERIHRALVMGIRDYFRKSGFQKATLGLSGGIDSAVVLALTAEALGKENVLPILMPSHFSSDHSVDDSLDMVQRLGCKHEIIPVKNIYDAFLNSLEPQFKGLDFNVAEENLQARIRGTLLMAMSNKFGYILLNTSNKSENAVGYGTLYGDMCGGLSVIGDVYKMQVYALARHLNKQKAVIPENIIVKAPSAELRPGQKDSDSLPDYDILDRVLFQYIEMQKTTDEIIARGYDKAIVNRTITLVNRNEYKRVQVPPILRVSPKAFGMGRRMPIVGKYLT